ncbi:MAG: hypothetical protein ACYCUM_00310 [Solirubrobacteraceae bacterium]
MSTATSGADGADALRQPAPVPIEHCPLCGGELGAEQDWCLGCGAAARTRLAATPKWWLPVSALSAVAFVSVCVLVAALVKLAA